LLRPAPAIPTDQVAGAIVVALVSPLAWCKRDLLAPAACGGSTRRPPTAGRRRLPWRPRTARSESIEGRNPLQHLRRVAVHLFGREPGGAERVADLLPGRDRGRVAVVHVNGRPRLGHHARVAIELPAVREVLRSSSGACQFHAPDPHARWVPLSGGDPSTAADRVQIKELRAPRATRDQESRRAIARKLVSENGEPHFRELEPARPVVAAA
jgi:hypothetical protein